MGKVLDIGLSLVASLLVGLVALWTMEALQLKYALAFTLSLMVFTLMTLYTPYDKSFSLPLTRTNIGVKIWWLSWFLAILLVILIRPLEISSQFLVWDEIPAPIWLRLIASFSLTTIYPGYALTKLILRGRDLQLLEKTVFSLLSSIFISSTIAFVGTLIDGSIGTVSFLVLLSVNIFLLILAGYLTRHNLFSKVRVHHVIRIKLTDITRALLLCALITFILLSIYSVNFPDKFVPTIDQWSYYGNIVRALNGTLFSFVPSHYWLYMYEGLFIFATGLPSINAYMALFVLCLLPILSFYLMSTSFWNKREALVVTTAYALFSGFGGIYANYLRLTDGKDITWIIGDAASKTYDISTGAVSFSFYLYVKLIGFSTLFALIYLIYAKRLTRLGRGILMSAIFALGYLSHVAEMYVFLIVTAFLLLFSRKDVSDLKGLPYGFVLGLIIVAIVDLLAPQKRYGFYYLLTGHFDLIALGLLGMVTFLCVLSRLRLNLSRAGNFMIKVAKRLILPIVIGSIYLLTLCIIIWGFLHPAFSIGQTGGTFVWYLYPVRLGIAPFMAVLGACQLFRTREFKILKLSLIIILVSIGLERVLGYFIVENMRQFALFFPVRMVEFAWIGIAVLAAPIIVTLLKHVANADIIRKFSRVSKKFATATLLAMIIIAGSSSTLYNVQIRSTPSITLTDSELEALDFLRNQTPLNVTILALGYSVNKINDFGGRYPVMYYQPAIFGANTFEAFVDTMRHNLYELYGHFPIRYFWLSNSDVNELKKYENGYVVRHLLNYLPVIYANNEVKVFEIPSFFPPSPESDLAVIKSTSDISEQSIFMSTIALAGLNYTIQYDFDLNPSATMLFLTNDPDDDSLNSLVASRAKKLVVFNTDASTGQFATLLKINTNPHKKQTVNGISGSSMNLSLPSIDIPTFYSLDQDVEPLAYYTRDGRLVSPYAFRKTVANQEIIYVEIYPYFETLQRNAGTDAGVEIFTKLGTLINILDLQLPKCVPPSKPIERAILFGQTTFEGDVSFNPASFYIPASEIKWTQAIGWKEDAFSASWSTSTNKPENGSIDASMNSDVLTVAFNAATKNVWQYFFLDVPNINASQFRFLFLREDIEASFYNLGYLRIVAGGYTYRVRGWTGETHSPGHPWKTYVYDLNKAIPEKSEAPTSPEGQITQIYWTGYSTGENGGAAKLYLDYMMLTNSPMTPTNYGEIEASLDLSEASSVFIDGILPTEKTFVNMKTLGMQISGDFNFTFTSTEARLTPPSVGRYSKVAFNKGCNLTLSLTSDSKISFTTLIDGKPSNITVSRGKIHVNLTPLKGELVVYMSDAQVSANGYTEFEKAFISWPYGIYNPELPMEVNGPITFRVNVMDQDFSLISELKVGGEYKVLTQQQVKWNEWDIPWLTVLTSPYHIILVVSIVTGLVFYNLQKKHKIKTLSKLK